MLEEKVHSTQGCKRQVRRVTGFIHKSVYEYFVALAMVCEMEGPSLVQNPLNGTAIWNQRLLSQDDPAILLFVADYVRIDAETRQLPLLDKYVECP